MGFWKWYWGVLKSPLNLRWIKGNRYGIEVLGGCALVGAGLPIGIIMGLEANPLWFIFLGLVPIGITLWAHAFWCRFKEGSR